MFTPNKAAATTNHAKLEATNAYVASITEANEHTDASAKLRRLPIARMSIVAGTVVDATLTTMMDTGSVASAGLSDSFVPMMPPSVTRTIDPVAEMS
jgi:hypothetical protein